MTDLALESHETRLRGRPREFDEDDVLDRAIGVFSERGYHGAAISDLADAMKLTPGSIYKAFKDKRGVLFAAFDRYRAVRSKKLNTAISGPKSGRDKIRSALVFYADAAHGASGQRGCLVVAIAAELAVTDPVAAARVALAHETNETLMRDLIVLGQSDGSIPVSLDPPDTARALLCLLQGMRILGKTRRSRAEMSAVVDVAMKLIA